MVRAWWILLALGLIEPGRLSCAQPPASGATPSEEEAGPPEAGLAEPSGGYVVVPMHGRLGREVVAPGVRAIMDRARQLGVRHIVFSIDCSGGAVEEARAIAAVIEESRAGLTLHAHIRREALGPAVILPVMCETVLVAPGSRMGGAEGEIGSSAWASELARLADERGLPGCVYRAMVQAEHVVYAWRDEEGGAARFSDERPSRAEAADAVRLDGEDDVLVLSAAQLERWGLARPFEGDAAGLGEALGIPGWRLAGRFGETLMEREREDRLQLLGELDRLRGAMRTARDDADRHDPRKLKLRHDSKAGLLSGASQITWREHADRAIADWQRVQALASSAGLLSKRLREHGADHVLPIFDDDVGAEAALELRWLRANRVKHYIDRTISPGVIQGR